MSVWRERVRLWPLQVCLNQTGLRPAGTPTAWVKDRHTVIENRQMTRPSSLNAIATQNQTFQWEGKQTDSHTVKWLITATSQGYHLANCIYPNRTAPAVITCSFSCPREDGLTRWADPNDWNQLTEFSHNIPFISCRIPTITWPPNHVKLFREQRGIHYALTRLGCAGFGNTDSQR